MIVSTSTQVTDMARAQAMQHAIQSGWSFEERRARSLQALRTQDIQAGGDGQLLILAHQTWRWYPAERTKPVFYHPSMGYVRVKRLLQGESDNLLVACDVRAGDAVLDCTAGMAADALVFSYAVGAQGTVTTLESTPGLAFLLQQGLASYETELEQVNAALRRIQVRHIDHCTYLQAQPDRSVDLVYFDPMFRTPLTDSTSLEPVRSAVNAAALSAQVVAEAVRVARRSVILKETADSGEFARLGFTCRTGQSGKIRYGVIDV
jgi:16S rRNA (guanine1516-N2)-methyltransferase